MGRDFFHTHIWSIHCVHCATSPISPEHPKYLFDRDLETSFLAYQNIYNFDLIIVLFGSKIITVIIIN